MSWPDILMPPARISTYPAKHYCLAVQYLYFGWSDSSCLFCGSFFTTPSDDSDLLDLPEQFELIPSSVSPQILISPPSHAFPNSLSSSFDDSDWLSNFDLAPTSFPALSEPLDHDSDASHDHPAHKSPRRRRSIRTTSTKQKALTCEECQAQGRTATFGRPAELLRHTETQHRRDERFKAGLVYECPWSGCDRTGQSGFLRLDHLLEHRRGVHKESIPKRHRRRNTASSAGTQSP